MKNEPAVTTASITAGVTAIIALLSAFGLPLTDQQQTAILGIIAVIGPLAVGFVTRRHVVPKSNVAAQVDTATGTVVAGDAADAANGTTVAVVDQTGPTNNEGIPA